MYSPSNDQQVFRRPMTDSERMSTNKVFKNAKKQALPMGFMALVFAAIGIVTGAGSLDFSTSKGMTSIMILVIGIAAFFLAISTITVRNNVAAAQNDGSVVVVRGQVRRQDGKMNTSGMMVGPLVIGWNKKSISPLQEGTFAEVACIPKLKSVVSINRAGLDNLVKIVVPNDLEMRASTGAPAYPAQPTPVDQGTAPAPEAMAFCPSCGKPSMGLAFCTDCGTKLK